MSNVNKKPRTLVQEYSTVVIKSLVEKAETLKKLVHRPTHGQLKEFFVSNALKLFLTSQFGIGSGVIVNQKGEQSNQTDIIIYDNRILPPFINERGIGLYPAEAVIATIEVKSNLGSNAVLKSEKAAKKLHDEIYNPKSSYYGDYDYLKPLCMAIGFYGGSRALYNESEGQSWLQKNKIKYLSGLCVINKYSWIKFKKSNHKGWKFQGYERETNEETKRFIAVILDNIRIYSEERFKKLLKATKNKDEHKDWLGIYIRDQKVF